MVSSAKMAKNLLTGRAQTSSFVLATCATVLGPHWWMKCVHCLKRRKAKGRKGERRH